MANFKKLEMAKVLSHDSRIVIRKSFFGFITTAVFAPTGSTLTIFQNDYTSEQGEVLKRLLACSSDNLEQFTKQVGIITPSPMGPARIEGCISADHQFAALQLFGYSDFEYRPLTEVKTYEGWEAELISTLF